MLFRPVTAHRREGDVDWIYLASRALGNESDTVAFALQEHAISRPAFAANGIRIPNVGKLRPGDRIVLACRRPTLAARVLATVAAPPEAVAGTQAIDVVSDTALVEDLRSSGFQLVAGADGREVAHVIHLTDVRECDAELRGDYKGQTTLRRLAPEDSSVWDSGPAVEPEVPVELTAQRPPAPARTARTVTEVEYLRGYEVAAGLNRCVGAAGPGPFWGCPSTRETTVLTSRRIGRFSYPYEGLHEWRATELRARQRATVQSTWKLNCGVSVGGQTIVGIHRLQQVPWRLGARCRLWPFESGWQLPDAPDTVLGAEIFPSVVPLDDAAGGVVKDERQVRSCVRHAAVRDSEGHLVNDLAGPAGLDADIRERATTEEGWILFA